VKSGCEPDIGLPALPAFTFMGRNIETGDDFFLK
jgi:hypothetical protein